MNLTWVFVVVAAGAVACAERVRVPEVASHNGDTPVLVPYPPPAARAEVIPQAPSEEALWVDGYWMWKGTTYSWYAGRWVKPGPGMGYAPAEVVRLRDGNLMFYAPKWTRLEKE